MSVQLRQHMDIFQKLKNKHHCNGSRNSGQLLRGYRDGRTGFIFVHDSIHFGIVGSVHVGIHFRIHLRIGIGCGVAADAANASDAGTAFRK